MLLSSKSICSFSFAIFTSGVAGHRVDADAGEPVGGVAILLGGEPVTVIASSGAGVPTFAPVIPSIGFVVMWPLSRPAFSPTFVATVRTVAALVTRFETSPSVVGALETGAAPSGASGWPR